MVDPTVNSTIPPAPIPPLSFAIRRTSVAAVISTSQSKPVPVSLFVESEPGGTAKEVPPGITPSKLTVLHHMAVRVVINEKLLGRIGLGKIDEETHPSTSAAFHHNRTDPHCSSPSGET